MSVSDEAASAAGDGSTTPNRILYLSLHLFQSASIDKRSNFDSFFQPISNAKLPNAVNQCLRERLHDAFMHVETICADTGLPCVQELIECSPLGGMLRICIGEDNKWSMAAKLKRDSLHLIGRHAKQNLADFG